MSRSNSNRQTTPLKFDLVDLPDEGKTLEGDVTPAQLQLEDEARRSFLSPLRFRLHLSPINSGHDLLVQGEIAGAARVVCDRCDTPFEWSFTADGLCHEYENAFGKTIDLTEQIREDILLDFPQHFLCQDDCQGLCPKCGANLNDGPCGCPQDTGEDEADEDADGGSSPWAALDSLKLPPQ